MGSFNVSCSISNLSITPGTRCALIPLIRNKYHYPGPDRIGSMFVSDSMPAHFFYPFSFPIFGKYDDYGRIRDVERNQTVETLEKFFGVTIEQLVDILTSGRDAEDSYSVVYEVLGINKKAVSKHYYFSSKYLLDLGFTKTKVSVTKKGVTSDKTAYRFADHETYVRVVIKELSTSNGKQKYPHYKIYSKGKFRKMGGFSSARDFLRDYREVTGYYVCYPADKQEKVKLLETLSAMFVHGEVYQALSEIDMGESGKPLVWETAAYVNEQTLKALGFLYTGNDEKIERYNKIYKHPAVDTHFIGSDGAFSHIYSSKTRKQVNEYCFHPNTFIKSWLKLTGHQLELPVNLKGTSVYFSKFDAYRDSLIEVEKLIKDIEVATATSNDDDEIEKSISLWRHKDLLLDSKICFGFVPRYERDGLIKLYDEAIKDGSIKSEFVSFANFFDNLYSLNKFLFPGPYAGQSGNNWCQKFLAKKIEEIVTEEEKERAKWNDDIEDDE